VSQVALVADEHDDNVAVGVITQLSQPSFHVLVRQMLSDIVDKQRTDGTAVVSAAQATFYTALLKPRVGRLGTSALGFDSTMPVF